MTDARNKADAEAKLQEFMELINANRPQALSMLRIFWDLALDPNQDDGVSALLGRTATGDPFHFDLKALADSILSYVDEPYGANRTRAEVRTEESKSSDTEDFPAPSEVFDATERRRAEGLHDWWQGVCKVRSWPGPTDLGRSLLSMSIWAHMKYTMQESEEAQFELEHFKPTIQ